jgi:uncharacterized protein (DUF697 family)
MSTYEYETGGLELGEHGESGEQELEAGGLGELGETGEQEQFLGNVLGGALGGLGSPLGALGGALGIPLSEAQEMELASELLGVGSEQELEQFLGDIFKGVVKAVGGAINSPVGQALGGVLKNVAKAALPAVGGALGSFVAPGVGTAIGSQLGSMAGGLFEMESEAGAEQAEFEVARNFVRLSASAAQKAATAPAHLPPNQVARGAVVQAARQIMPAALGAPAAPGVRGGTAAGAAYGQRRPVAGFSPEQRRNLAALSPSARLAAGYGPAQARPARPAGGFGAPRHRGYGAPGYWSGGWDVGVEEPLGAGVGGNGDSVPYGLGGAQRTGRWVRRGRKIVLFGV